MNQRSITIQSRSIILISLLIALLAVSFSAIFIEWSTAPSSVIGMYRLWMSVLLLLPLAWRKRRELKRLSLKDICLLALSGLFLGLHFLFWIQSLKETSVASSMIITSLEPIFVVIGSLFVFRSRLNARGILSMGFAIVGCIVVASRDFGQSHGHLQGDLLSLTGTAAVCVYMIAGQQVRRTVSSTMYNTMVFFVAGLVLFVYTVASKSPLVHYSARNWLMFVLLALVSTILGHGIFNWLLDRVSATTVSMTILGEPVGAIVLAYFLLGQPILPIQAVGSFMCLIGVLWFLRSSASMPSNNPNDEKDPSGQKAEPTDRSNSAQHLDPTRA